MTRILKHLCALFLAVFLLGSSLIAQEWREGNPLNIARSNAAAAYLDGYIYVIGGTGSGGVILSSVERYDILTSQWDQAVAQLDAPRSEAVAMVHDGKIFLIGGIEEDGDIEDDVLIYDPASNSWDEGEDLKKSRRGHSGFYANNTMCILGGSEDDGDLIEEIEYYDPVEQKWEEAPGTLTSPITRAFVAAVDDSVYRFGGSTNFPQFTAAKGQFDASWNFQWTDGPALSMGRANGATVVVNNQVCLIGGVDINNAPSDLVDVYVPARGEIVPGESLPTPRRDLVAVFANDSIFAIGGYTSSLNQPLNRVDIFPGHPGSIDLEDTPISLPRDFELATAYPNPFNGRIQFEVQMGKRQTVTFRIFNLNGQAIATVYSGILAPGRQTLSWVPGDSGYPLSSGIYFAVLEGPSSRQAIKISYIR